MRLAELLRDRGDEDGPRARADTGDWQAGLLERQGRVKAERLRRFVVRQGEHWRLASAHMSFIADAPGSPPFPAAATGHKVNR